MPPTQDWIAEQLGEDISPGAAFTPEANIRLAAWFLRFLLDYYDGDLEMAVLAYNGGVDIRPFSCFSPSHDLRRPIGTASSAISPAWPKGI